MATLTHARTHAHRQAMIEEFDLDQDGEISEAEFVSGASRVAGGDKLRRACIA